MPNVTLFRAEAIGSEGFLNTKDARNMLKEALDKVAAEALKKLEKTVRTWETPAVFTVRKTAYIREIQTKDPIWLMLNVGTPAHPIESRQTARSGTAHFLEFKKGFTPKTTPGLLSSKMGGSYGAYRRKKKVAHPGTEPREWTLIITGQTQPKLQAEVQKVVDRIVKTGRRTQKQRNRGAMGTMF